MSINISYEIERLIKYGISKGLINECDRVYTRNRILETLGINEFIASAPENEDFETPEPILDKIISWAIGEGKLDGDSIAQRDLFDTKIMSCLMPRPSEIIKIFNTLYKKDKVEATNYFYDLSKNSNYIRMSRIKNDVKWTTKTEFGEVEITINMSKPEKDPKKIAAQRNTVSNYYPKCLLCKENEGYAGRIDHPARQNHRIIPVILNREQWYFQYSPYVYYGEHSIVFKEKHEPMKITKETFIRILDFVEQFPHYFLGSNADLPIVGGSILSHDHFQGGKHEFAMAKACVEKRHVLKKFPGIILGRVKWPMSVIRLEGSKKDEIVESADYIYKRWQRYSDECVSITSNTKDVMHNTVTPIARIKDGKYQMDLVLRNNRTTEEYPEGIFHPHRELHHLKKENIGLIEVMGLAVLPSRLDRELKELKYYLVNRDKLSEIYNQQDLVKHVGWCYELAEKYPCINGNNFEEIVKKEIGFKFVKVLEHAGVFKLDSKGQYAFNKFIDSLQV